MAPLLYLVRYDAHHIRDATLTEVGKEQCARFQRTFPLRNVIDLVHSSPLRRAIQNTILSFGPALARAEVPLLLVPNAQEVSSKTYHVGLASEDLQMKVAELFEGQQLPFDIKKIDYRLVSDNWNSKVGFWAPQREEVEKRAAALHSWLYTLPEMHVLLVTHGTFLHYLTEDWTGDDPKRGTAYLNCEVRQFSFAHGSDVKKAHIVETEGGKKLRRSNTTETDSSILAEVAAVK
ncbi:uncharacterized protein RSE6_09808 [Rhynchosporium secalis]|uniref:Phosphoglycerate mutase family protein n=1 Tax=Rhynchosporium secalis TaxID=38038 RepID=A0A1E1MIY5_RHYSE|nr:uncharacterized protein RSE6_09808 [Rhynchosporium secalis]